MEKKERNNLAKNVGTELVGKANSTFFAMGAEWADSHQNLKDIVKEVDLEKEIELVKGDYEQVDVAWNNDFDFIARHFYELGLKAKGE